MYVQCSFHNKLISIEQIKSETCIVHCIVKIRCEPISSFRLVFQYERNVRKMSSGVKVRKKMFFPHKKILRKLNEKDFPKEIKNHCERNGKFIKFWNA